MPDIRVTVRVKPGSSRARVGGSYGPDGHLVVAVTARPVDGAANEAVLKALAKALGIPPRRVTISSGHSARTKVLVLSVDQADSPAVASRLADLLST